MLTRIEVDGFKNLLGFSAEFGPFTCIAGPNAAGKSNLFDAIEFLSLLAELPLKEAAKRIRGGGEIRDLFWTDGKNRADRMHFAVEMLAEPMATALREGEREQGTRAQRSYRYELTLGREESDFGVDRLALVRESVTERHLDSTPRFPGVQHVRIADGTGNTIENLGEHRQIFLSAPFGLETQAVRREIQSWRRLALEPMRLRLTDNLDDIEDELTVAGDHLPATIYRLAHESHDGDPPDPEGFYAQLCLRLSDLVHVRGIEADRDDKHRLISLEVEDPDGGRLPARALSDGTLRFLAFAVLSFIRKQRLLCIEEPENGIHPSRMSDLVDLIKDLATNPEHDLQHEDTFRQVIVNTHSSGLVREVYRRFPEDLLMASTALTGGPGRAMARVLRLHPMVETWRCSASERGVTLPVVDYVGRAVRQRLDVSAAEDS
jgi:predicted ATPase